MIKILLIFSGIFFIISLSPNLGYSQKKEIKSAIEKGKTKEGFYAIEFLKPKKKRKVEKVARALGLVVFKTTEGKNRSAFRFLENMISGLGITRKHTYVKNAVLIDSMDLKQYHKKVQREKALARKIHHSYDGQIELSGSWWRISNFESSAGKTGPLFIMFYESMGRPFAKTGTDVNQANLKLKQSETLDFLPLPNTKNSWKTPEHLYSQGYRFWAVDSNQIAFNSFGMLGVVNIYEKSKQDRSYESIFYLDNMQEVNGRIYIKTEEGCLALNVAKTIEVSASWDGNMLNGFCTGAGSLSYSSRYQIPQVYFKGNLELGIPEGEGCLKIDGNSTWDCGKFIAGSRIK